MGTPELSIVIVSYNARADLERCLESLHAPPPSLTHDIVVVDNQSADGSADAARRWPDVQVIEAGRNLGFSRANNLGIRATQGAAVLLLNSDTIVPPGAIDRLVGELQAHPDVAVVGPRLLDGQGRPELSFGPMISPWNEWRQKQRMRAYAKGDPLAVAYVREWTGREHRPDWVTGACLLVWRKDAEAVGLLDERYFMYTEDVDFCAAVRARGRGVLFTPAVDVQHLRGRSAASAPAATASAYRRSHVAFYDKHHPAWAWLLRAYLRVRRQR